MDDLPASDSLNDWALKLSEDTGIPFAEIGMLYNHYRSKGLIERGASMAQHLNISLYQACCILTVVRFT